MRRDRAAGRLRRSGLLAIGVCGALLGGTDVALADYPSTVLSDDPFAYYRLDETGTATAMQNEVPGGADGTHELTPVLGVPGAMEFETPNLAISYTDADADRSRFSAGASYADYSIEFWMITTMANSNAVQWYNGQGLVDGEVNGVTSDTGTSLVGQGNVGFGVGNPDTTIKSTTDVQDGDWHHVVATRSSAGVMKLYVDGALEAQANGPTGARSNSNFSIGSLDTGTFWYAGGIDEVAVYKHVLSDADVSEHYTEATVAGDVLVLVRDYLLGGEGTVVSEEHGIDCGPITDDCEVTVPFGTEIEFTAIPAPGSRFGEWDDDSGCEPLTSPTCTFVADDPGFSDAMVLGSNFHYQPATIAAEMAEKSDDAAAKIDKQLDAIAFPKNDDPPSYASFLVPQNAANFGDSGGLAAVVIPTGDVSNIESGRGTISPRPPEVNWLLGSDGATLLGSDGATLLGSDGATLIGSDGATRMRRAEKACGIKASANGVPYVLGRYAAEIPSGGGLGVRSVSFEFTEEGKQFLDAFASMNLKRKKKDKKPVPLPITYVEAIQPPDEVGAGGAYDVHCVEKGK